MHDSGTRRSLHRGRAVVSRVVVAVGEAIDVAGEADQVAGDDRPDTEQLGEAGPRSGDSSPDAPVGLVELNVETLHVGQQVQRQLPSGRLGGGDRMEVLEEPGGVGSVEFFGDPAW